MSSGSSQAGFSLVELLVVVLIIGILTTIALPSLLGARDKAHDGSARASLRTAAQTSWMDYLQDGQFVTDEFQGAELSLTFTQGSGPSSEPWTSLPGKVSGNARQVVEVSDEDTVIGCIVSQGSHTYCFKQDPGSGEPQTMYAKGKRMSPIQVVAANAWRSDL